MGIIAYAKSWRWKSVFCVDYIFRKAGFILFKWNYILKYFCDFHIGIFLVGKERKKIL